MFLTFQDQYELCKRRSGNENTAIVTGFKDDINIATGEIRHKLSKYIFHEDRTETSVANQQGYDLDPRIIRVHTITYTSGSIPYYLEEVKDPTQWKYLNETDTASADIPTHYFLTKDQVLLYPKPGSSGDTITITGEERYKQMTADDYTTGTVAVTNASASITGTSTVWSAQFVGRYLTVDNDGYWYEIETRTSDTAIALDRTFRGATGSTLSYTIGEQGLGVYEDLHMLPVFYALSSYYATIEDQGQEAKYITLWNDGIRQATANYGKKSASSVIPNLRNRLRRRDPNKFSVLS